MRLPRLHDPLYELRLLGGKLRGWRSVRRAGRNLKVDGDHHHFWESFSKGVWEEHSLSVVDHYVRPGDVVYDVGAWIGPITLWAAHRAEAVYALEPDPVAYRYLIGNVKLNEFHHVHTFHLGLAPETGPERMFARGGASGDSESSVLAGTNRIGTDDASSIGATGHFVTVEDWLRLSGAAPPDFVKMDIEGAEFELIPAIGPWLEEHRPVLYLSTHAPHLPESQRRQALTRITESLGFYPRIEDSRGRETDSLGVTTAGSEDYEEFLFLPS